MILERATLALAGLVFGAIGVMFLSDPAYTALVDIETPTGAARADVRAVYGGLDLALGLFALIAVFRPALVYGGLLMSALAFGGLVGGRLLGIVLDDPESGITGALLAAEVTGLLWSVAVLARHVRRQRVAPAARDR